MIRRDVAGGARSYRDDLREVDMLHIFGGDRGALLEYLAGQRVLAKRALLRSLLFVQAPLLLLLALCLWLGG